MDGAGGGEGRRSSRTFGAAMASSVGGDGLRPALAYKGVSRKWGNAAQPVGSGASAIMHQSTMPLTTMAEGKSAGLRGYRSPLNYLLVFVPLGIIAGFFRANAVMVFLFNFIGCIPLATILGRATEDVAEHTNDTIGGLINATFGNAVELILSIAALRNGQLDVVRNTLVGSILSNLLLVLGSSLFFGGLVFREQEVLPVVVENNSLALGVALSSFALPTLFAIALSSKEKKDRQHTEELFSLVTSILMLTVYGMYLLFQLWTHADFFDADDDESMNDSEIDLEQVQAHLTGAHVVAGESAHLLQGNRNGSAHRANFLDGVENNNAEVGEEDDEDDIPPASMRVALTILVIDVLFVSVCCEYLVDSIDDFSRYMRLGTTFVAVILLPVIGNAVEHLSAVMVAMKNKMDLSIGIACGSSVQIAMFAAPVMVLMSWLVTPAGMPKLTLKMELLDFISVGIAVFTANQTLRDASTNWLEGASLVLIYFMIGAAFYLLG